MVYLAWLWSGLKVFFLFVQFNLHVPVNIPLNVYILMIFPKMGLICIIEISYYLRCFLIYLKQAVKWTITVLE